MELIVFIYHLDQIVPISHSMHLCWGGGVKIRNIVRRKKEWKNMMEEDNTLLNKESKTLQEETKRNQINMLV